MKDGKNFYGGCKVSRIVSVAQSEIVQNEDRECFVEKEKKMPNKGFTRCKFCNKVIVRGLLNLGTGWIHAATKAVPTQYYGCNYYLSKDKKLGPVMRSYGEMAVAQAEPKITPTTENAS
jgi:hypothetical protein